MISFEAKTLQDLVELYCLRCTIGIYNCKIPASECNKICQDRDYDAVMAAHNIIKEGSDGSDY